jgi:hypothetical protein
MPSRVTRRSYSGQVSGKILLARGYRDGRENRYRSGSGLVLFRLMVPPLQLEVMGPYLVRGE